MNLDRVTPGPDIPHRINIIIEVPYLSDPVKYEVDKESGAMVVDRFMGTAMHYPCNYGYVPHTISEDGDPVDVLVITPYALISGSVICARPVGMLRMTDDKGPDSKVLAVPVDNLTSLYSSVETLRDLPAGQLAQIAHFFQHYKDLETGKWVRVDGWAGPDEAKEEVLAGVERFRTTDEPPSF